MIFIKFDLTFTITATIAFVSLVSPIITALINNYHSRNMKRLEIEQENIRNNILHKRDLLENYLTATAAFSYEEQHTPEQIKELLNSYYLILPYIPGKYHTYFSEYSELIVDGVMDESNFKRARYLIGNYIIPCIKTEIEKM
ncbi:hypothetical protein [Latilactobacillus fragifolii]|uniref:hypothetical protein n=1 Tax=Latilactobacillus fragifolii TaxID=2814244 RepID=UPI001ABABE85|nr:hypothetical protein [Latilactobacillus fragifolii]